ncbi:MAG: DnaJ domain-containing protein [Syntrophaceae bacterium]|nr:DnaJ domain-containing protein [Syntrophaceae bacterium]HOC59231.1 DnaJ domain-containing protein [Smithellaceae bacterium]HQM44244.1 DnaJ domain-containing protein [Smithellaceae bacterium]
MLAAEVSKQDLFKACESLFGSDIDVSVEFLRYLKPSGVKAAYRRKAMETHPDRAAALDGHADFMADRFKEVSLAYQLLQDFLAAPWKYSLDESGTLYKRKPPAERPADRRRETEPAPKVEPHYAGRMPSRRLLFGQYLYYAGHVSLSTLVKAIVWQRMQRPSVGAIAVSWGWLEGGDIGDILRNRRYGEKFGECAFRLGRLSRHQLAQLLEKQKQSQPLIGKYFMEQNILSAQDLFKRIVDMKVHNKKFWK